MKTSIHNIEILLVEDNPDDAVLTVRALKKHNLANNLVHLTDGQEALDFIFGKDKFSEREIEDQPKIIMLDLKMPKIDGLQVLRAIREDERTKSIPVVIMTSSKEDKDIEECYKLGVNSYLVKPVAFDDFSKAVVELGFYWLLLNQPPR